LPNTAIKLGENFGRLMNYGDGLYGGQFVGAMYAEAFFESDPVKIVEVGLQSIPEGSQYAEAVRDVMQWYSENPDNWEATWELIEKKYHKNPDYRRFTYGGTGGDFNIDAKLNGAYIVMGMLYGNSDPDKTIVVSMRCGQDSDCNPSNAAGILFTAMGYENVPEKFTSAIDNETKFSFTEYTFPGLIDVSEKLAREAVKLAGGRIEVNADGEEEFVIPVSDPAPSALEQSWEPGPVSDNTFSDEEWAQVEGHWIFNYSLLILLILAIVLLKENRNLNGLLIFIPLAVIFIITWLLRGSMNADMIATINFLDVYESLAIGLAILLLVGHKIAPLKWYISIPVALIVLAIVGFVGISGAADGRITASTKLTSWVYSTQAIGWLIGITFTAFMCRKKFSKLRFNLWAVLSFFIFQIVVLYAVGLMMAGGPFGGLANNISFLLIGSVAFGVLLYLVTVIFLILSYLSSEYENRVMNWLAQGNV